MKIGDYVRTKYGIIGKIQTKNYNGYSDWIIDTLYYNDDEIYKEWTCGIKEYDITKSSPNIIDLIEEGDYVDGEKITYITNKGLLITDGGYDILKRYKTITSVVTNEQFKAMEYKIESDVK
jgi:hypothetical protein